MSRLQILVKQVKQDMRNAKVPFDEYVPIMTNNRLKTVAGRCKSRNGVAYVVEINGNMLKIESDEFLKNVICHELLHSAKECIGEHHGGMWKRYANLMNARNHNYNITRCYDSKELCKSYRGEYKYKVVCEDCGKTYYYRQKGKVISTLMMGHKYYRCSKCNNDNLKVVKL